MKETKTTKNGVSIIVDLTYYDCFEGLKTRKKPTAIVIHHTCTKTPQKTRSALKKKNESTHYEVDRDGTIYQYADEMLMASHCGAPNYHTIGVDVTHMESAEFTEKQLDSVKALVRYLCDKFDIDDEVHEEMSGIWPHRAIKNTKCPDNFPMEILDGVCHEVQ
jgi:N-acetyl-anhydromuramyl-L-alanine amidase AmpD